MANNIHVKLTSTVPPELETEDNNGQNIVARARNPQVVTWRLKDELASGSFVSLSAQEPGFEWIDQPPLTALFSAPMIWANGKALTIVDFHTSSASEGEWIYRLRVTLNGVVYATGASTPPTGTILAINNPIIINR